MWNAPQLMRQMSSHLLAEWMVYAQVEPFGDDLLDTHLAQLNANMINKDRKRGSQMDPNQFRMRKERKKWDPQEWFQGLKDTANLMKK